MELLKSAFCSAGEGSFRGKTDLQFYKSTREILLCFTWLLLSMSCPSCCGHRAQSPLREQDHVFGTFSQNCDLILKMTLWKGSGRAPNAPVQSKTSSWRNTKYPGLHPAPLWAFPGKETDGTVTGAVWCSWGELLCFPYNNFIRLLWLSLQIN